MLRQAIRDTYNLLDKIDKTLEISEVFPLSQTVELANLSSMIGNIFASAIAKHSNAVVNAAGMEILQVIYCDLERVPLSQNGKVYRSYQQLFQSS
jgi:hypothetical protein